MAYMSDSERKEVFNWKGHHFRFETCYDLSNGVGIKPLYKNFKGDSKDMELFACDLTCFMAYYMMNIYEELNGFSGFDTVKWSFMKVPESIYCKCDNQTPYTDANGKTYCYYCGKDIENNK